MKTVFKAGQKVYDQVHYPDCEGKVIKVYEDSILVIFEGVENYYSLEGRSGDSLPTLSTKPYKVEFPGFEQKSPVPTFEEAWNNSHNSKEIFYPSNCDKLCSGYPTKELADASEALRKLIFLREYYNEGWDPNWSNGSIKYCIVISESNISDTNHISSPRVMCFKTKEIRDKFLEEQRELLEIAKPLL